MTDGEALRILFAEDDPAHAEIVKRNLLKARVANVVHHVEDGVQALEFLENQGAFADQNRFPLPHIILMDIRMPRMDGLEALKMIKEHPRFSHIPVVILTSSDTETDIAKAYKYRASSYLVKPISFDSFRELLDQFGFYWLAWNRYPKDSSSSQRA